MCISWHQVHLADNYSYQWSAALRGMVMDHDLMVGVQLIDCIPSTYLPVMASRAEALAGQHTHHPIEALWVVW